MKVIWYNNLPARMPIALTAIVFLILDRLNAHWLVWTIAAIAVSVAWTASLWKLLTDEPIDIITEYQNSLRKE